jgi:hypothetical protein
VTWLYEETGVNVEDLAVGVELNAIASLDVAVLVQVGHELIVKPAYCDEGSRVVGDFVLGVNRPLKHTTLLGDGVLGEWDDRNPLRTI